MTQLSKTDQSGLRSVTNRRSLSADVLENLFDPHDLSGEGKEVVVIEQGDSQSGKSNGPVGDPVVEDWHVSSNGTVSS